MSTAPTPSTEYLLACNGHVNLTQARAWSLTQVSCYNCELVQFLLLNKRKKDNQKANYAQIKVFMIEVIDKSPTYGVKRGVVSELKRLRTDILDLR